MVVTEVGIEMEMRDVQKAKAFSSMVFTEVGMKMEMREVQY